MKTKTKNILVALAVALAIILPAMAFFADLGDSKAFHAWESNYQDVANDPWHCRVFGC